MDDRLQHDPKTKQQIKDILYAFLYDPVQKRFKQRLDALIVRNAIMTGANHKSFTYKGGFYNCDTTPPPRKMNRLAPQLHREMDEYLADLKAINDTEVPYVLGFITQVLNSSNDLHDYLKVLPESVHRPIEKLIASCPCRTKRLSDEAIEAIRQQNQQSIALMKQRMVANLLI